MKTIFFYSFKGGVGRTQLLLNVAKYLTEKRNKKIAIVDFDLYAPGLSYLAKFKPTEEKKNQQYLVEYLFNLFSNKDKNIYSEKINDNLTLIPATNPKNMPAYHKALNNLSEYTYGIKESAEHRDTEISTFADKIAEHLTREISKIDEFDYIFYDGRTGITEVSDILFSKEIDLKVIVSSFNKQNINGIKSMLDMLSEQEQKHSIMRVLSPKPIGDRDKYKSIAFEADLKDDLDLRDKFDWMGTFEVPYDEEIVSNDFGAWEELQNEKVNKYIKSVVTIAEALNSKVDADTDIFHIINEDKKLTQTQEQMKLK